ncbi:MAG: pyrroline-5-carboxylate reductase, partial [Planctomycetota bacterium]
MSTIGFIGSGNMAEALMRGIISANLYAPRDVLISDIRKDRLDYLKEKYGVAPTSGNVELTSQVDVLVLSVKPRNMDEVLDEIKGTLKDSAVVISIAAGITIEKIAGHLGDVPIIRAMPNTPAMVGQGATAIVARNTSRRHLKVARE